MSAAVSTPVMMPNVAQNFPQLGRQVADEFSGLPIHCKQIVLILPLCRQHPDRQQRIMYLAALQLDVLIFHEAAVIADDRVAHRVNQRARAAAVRPLLAVLDADVVFVRQNPGR